MKIPTSLISFLLCATLLIPAKTVSAFSVKWRHTLDDDYERMTFGASPALADLGPDVNSIGGEFDQCLEVITGSDELNVNIPEIGHTVIGVWRCLDALGNLEWAVDTRTDESRSSVAVLNFIPGNGAYPEIVGGTTSGWNVEAMDRFGNFIWTFPDPPITGGQYLWHSSPAVGDIVPDVVGFEVAIGNRTCNALFCLQADPSDVVNDGLDYFELDDCFAAYIGGGGGTDGIDWDVIWIYNTAGPVISTPALGDIDNDGDIDVVFGDGYRHTYDAFGAPGGYIYCIDGPTGALRWRIFTGGVTQVVDASAALADFDDDGDLEVVIGASNGLLYFIDGDEDDDGTISVGEMSVFDMGAPIHSSAAIADVNGDDIYEIIVADMNGRTVCFQYTPPVSVSIIWERMLDTAVVSSPAIAGEIEDAIPWTHFCGNVERSNFFPYTGDTLSIFIASMGGNLYHLAGRDGSIVDSIHLANYIHTSPVIADIDLDCELEVVLTVCCTPEMMVSEPDTLFCLGTGLIIPFCRECAECIFRFDCPPVDTIIISSCPQQNAVFTFAETTFWDFPDTLETRATVQVKHGAESYNLDLWGASDRMNFNRVLYDTFEVSIWHNWNHGDTVTVVIDSIKTDADCLTAIDESVSFVIDINPPEISPFPVPGMILAGASVIHFNLTDYIAGVDWSSVEVQTVIIHPGGGIDSLPVEISVDSLVVNVCENDTLIVTVEVCDVIDDYGCSCPPNCTTYVLTYPVSGIGPLAAQILFEGISACVAQEIWITIADSNGVDSSTISIAINDDLYGYNDDEVEFENDTLRFIPPDSSFWSNNDTITVALITASDMHGNILQNPLSWKFMLDFEPPQAQLLEPGQGDTVANIHQRIEISLSDNLAGINVDSSWFNVRGRTFGLHEILAGISADSLSGNIIFIPDDFGIEWVPGESVVVYLHLCDAPDTCGPNCDNYQWHFMLLPPYSCGRMPNPFTPNDDEFNEYCQFYFPGLIYEEGKIYIYDIHGVLVNEIHVPGDSEAKRNSRWFGMEKNGGKLPQGIYLYLIEVNGEIVCDGTVTIAR